LKAASFAPSAGLGGVVPSEAMSAHCRPEGLIPIALAQDNKPFAIEGKDGLIILTDRPINAETPIGLLDDEVTPNHRHYIRNNGLVPERAVRRDLAGWTLTVDGEVAAPLKLDLAELKARYPNKTLQLQLECAGNGRAGFRPPPSGLQWKMGAICALCRREVEGRSRAPGQVSSVYVSCSFDLT
jgi:DMSO/TMAO reductase YedYZ molybdopterin-dependent catalytic subunit